MPDRLACCLTVSALLVLSSTALAAAGPAGQAAPRLVGNCRTATVQPQKVILTCADANSWIEKIRWQDWGQPEAVGTGTILANPCVPYCAAVPFSRFVHAPVVVVVSRLAYCPGKYRAYTRLVYSFPGNAAVAPRAVRTTEPYSTLTCNRA